MGPSMIGHVTNTRRLAGLGDIRTPGQIELNLPQNLQAVLIRMPLSRYPKLSLRTHNNGTALGRQDSRRTRRRRFSWEAEEAKCSYYCFVGKPPRPFPGLVKQALAALGGHPLSRLPGILAGKIVSLA